ILKGRFYLDESLKMKTKAAGTTDMNWTRRFGALSLFVQQDIKLIWRNKRPRTTVWISLLFLAYGLFFYINPSMKALPGFFVFAGIFISGVFVISFGQFIPAWDSNYYSMMMTQHIPLRKYLESKAGLLSFSVAVLFLLSIPYAYFGWKYVGLNLACALYNLGVNIPVILYAGSFNRKRIDLEKSQFMNYQGTGAAQWLVSLPLLLIPLGCWYAFYVVSSFEIAAVGLGLLGIAGVALRKYIMNGITRLYRRNKYAMINGFKQQGN
ncbi:MAG: hypothetical protein KDD04_02930, partial [Sinomicrobium sp.]|nr:hypothetical protein [Sinomicrobium sp.]